MVFRRNFECLNDGALRFRLVRRETSVSNSQPESQPVTDPGRLLLGAYLGHLLVPLVLVVDSLRIALATAHCGLDVFRRQRPRGCDLVSLCYPSPAQLQAGLCQAFLHEKRR
jgi:hypothetical protein